MFFSAGLFFQKEHYKHHHFSLSARCILELDVCLGHGKRTQHVLNLWNLLPWKVMMATSLDSFMTLLAAPSADYYGLAGIQFGTLDFT